MKKRQDYSQIPDVRDGLTRQQRVILYCLHQLQKEFGTRNVPTITLYGRVCEHLSVTETELQKTLQELGTLK